MVLYVERPVEGEGKVVKGEWMQMEWRKKKDLNLKNKGGRMGRLD